VLYLSAHQCGRCWFSVPWAPGSSPTRALPCSIHCLSQWKGHGICAAGQAALLGTRARRNGRAAAVRRFIVPGSEPQMMQGRCCARNSATEAGPALYAETRIQLRRSQFQASAGSPLMGLHPHGSSRELIRLGSMQSSSNAQEVHTGVQQDEKIGISQHGRGRRLQCSAGYVGAGRCNASRRVPVHLI